nr:MAG TPA: holin [Caudoviricetes sp.]
MDHILTIRLYAAAIGIVIGEFLGSFDDLLYALIAFVVADYITGVLKAIAEKNLSSTIGFKGICKKVCIFTLVGVANVLDVHIIGSGCVLRSAVIFFYISNEGISIIENAARMGLPVPQQLQNTLLRICSDKGTNTKGENDK